MNEDLSNQKFNLLTVLKKIKSINKRGAYLCLCDCGKLKKVQTYRLKHKTNPQKSCGCLTSSHTDPEKPRLSSAKTVYRSTYKDGNLSFEDFITLSQKPCYYCGSPPSNSANSFRNRSDNSSQFSIINGDFIYNGLDRKNNSRPHDRDNVVPSCSTCNWSKGRMSSKEFKIWIKKVYNHIT